ncbi:siderophore-interacting protein [Shinella sp.]|uniref:siderophore-interacting protein n=1 Tax=Shinella sp. TaxID=1870904 RepID=UPI0028B014CF|nr:siderophore-interacting protein [Shinella sp.]
MRRNGSFRAMHVLSSTRIAPRMQRLRLTGNDLHHFDTDANLHARAHIPARWDSDSLETFRAFIAAESREGSELVATRYYTIRRIDADAGWLDIDFALHDTEGPGCRFACTAKAGDICGLSGPCGLGIKRANRYLLVGDETALPAIARITENLGDTPAVHTFIFAEPEYFRSSVTNPVSPKNAWIPGEERQSFFSRLDELRSAHYSPDDPHFIWIAGERTLVRALNPLLSLTRKNRLLCVPYWGKNDG